MRWRTTCALLAVLIALAGCAGTFGAVTPQGAAAPPPARARVLVLGEIRTHDPAWDAYRPHFIRGLRDWAEKSGAFEQVLSEGTAASAEAVVVTGTLTEIDEGSAAMRWLVGMGAGQAKAKGEFQLRALDGAVLASFTARRSYLGGMGIGGAGFLDMEELVARLGATVAESSAKWLRGEPID
jgi:hypothetical protein